WDGRVRPFHASCGGRFLGPLPQAQASGSRTEVASLGSSSHRSCSLYCPGAGMDSDRGRPPTLDQLLLDTGTKCRESGAVVECRFLRVCWHLSCIWHNIGDPPTNVGP